ncbi:MAG: NADH-quinone oxidoreductase subunit C [Bacteroidales bacterium]
MSEFPENSINQYFPEYTLSQWAQFKALNVGHDKLYTVCEQLAHHPALQFDMLVCLTAIDRTTQLEVIYHLRSTTTYQELVVKTELVDPLLELPSVTPLWKSAELFEMEVYDMFGITFTGHPDLRRLFMPEDWEGYPLRKSYQAKDVADNYLKSHQLLINQQ